MQDIIVGEAELTSSPEEPEGDGEEGSGEDPGNMLLRAAKVLAAGGGSGGHSVTAGAAGEAGGPAAVDGPPGGGSSPGEGKRKRRSLGTAVVGGTGGTGGTSGTCDMGGTGCTGGPGGMGGLLDDAELTTLCRALQTGSWGRAGSSAEAGGRQRHRRTKVLAAHRMKAVPQRSLAEAARHRRVWQQEAHRAVRRMQAVHRRRAQAVNHAAVWPVDGSSDEHNNDEGSGVSSDVALAGSPPP